MTTTVKITNRANSNGNVHVRAVNASSYGAGTLEPGKSTEYCVTDASILTVIETMPSTGPTSDERTALYHGEHADEIIAKEVAGQDKMWGVSNDRADANSGQLLSAGLAQLEALYLRRSGEATAFDEPPQVYPLGWSGFRDYGSDVANLAVVVAFLRQEMKRLIALGGSTYRKPRDPVTQPYTGDQPAVQI